MQWLANICIRRPVFASVLMLVIIVFGALGYTRLGVDQFPNVDIPIVVITTTLPGAAPEEVENDISDKIEGVVNTISGIDELRSTSAEGISQVIVSFKLEKNSDVGAQEVRDKIDQIMPQLPKGTDRPIVSRVDTGSGAVLLASVRSKASIRDVTEIADKKVRRQIESIYGVGQVEIIGGLSRQVNVWLKPVELRSLGLSAADVQRALAGQNLSTPGGVVEQGPERVTLRVEGRVRSVEEMARIVIREDPGRSVRLEDVARVEDGTAEEQSYASIDGERTVVLSIKKQSGQNTIDVVDAVTKRFAEIEKTLPVGTKLEVIRDNSGVIRKGASALKEHLIIGSLLASLVVLMFLGNFRSTIIAAIAIPVSVIGTFGVMYLAGYTLNFLTLLALALAVGIVIDDAIVVLENIVRHVDELGMKPFPAAIAATKEIGLAVFATTLSLMAVFVPVAFMSGIVGRFLASFGLTMAFAIGVSMIVSFSLTPMLSARWIKKGGKGDAVSRFLGTVVNVVYRPIERVYMRILAAAMRKRWVVVILCVVSLGSCVPIAGRVPGGFLPEDDNAQFEIIVRGPVGQSVQATRLFCERIGSDVRHYDGVTHALVTVGEGATHASNEARVYVLLNDPRDRKASQFQLMDRVRQEIIKKAPHEYRITTGEVSAFSNGGQSNAGVQVAIVGSDIDLLAKYATNITEELKKVPGALDVDNTLVVGKPELRVHILRDRAAELGVRVSDIADTLRLLIGGVKVSSYAEGGEEYDVRVRADERYRTDADSLSLVTVPSAKKGSVALSNVVKLETASGPAEINRLGRQRQVTILANAKGGADAKVQKAIGELAAKQHMPASYQVVPVGRAKESGKLALNFFTVLVMSFVLMYLVLAAQFESWLHPVTILISLPLTVPFALLSLLIFGQTLNIFSGLGLIVLFGVVKKNSILQIDHTNHLRRQGKARLDAILEANRDRLRPILMTTLAFVAGMIPLMVSKGIGAGKDRTTAAVILGGQTLSLLLTLIAVPVVYSLLDDVSQFFARRRKAKKQDEDLGEGEIGLQASAEE
ncbi:MAG: efflux RND transporter permease subunit [Polyangiaceae bacterium]